jgi:hypothetical protein
MAALVLARSVRLVATRGSTGIPLLKRHRTPRQLQTAQVFLPKVVRSVVIAEQPVLAVLRHLALV